MLKGFKEFISRGNAIDLAVGMVIGAAFTAVVTALVKRSSTPSSVVFLASRTSTMSSSSPLAQQPCSPVPSSLAAFNFLLVAFALYFFIVLPMNALAARRKKEEAAETPEVSEDVQLLSEIRDLLKAQNNN